MSSERAKYGSSGAFFASLYEINMFVDNYTFIFRKIYGIIKITVKISGGGL